VEPALHRTRSILPRRSAKNLSDRNRLRDRRLRDLPCAEGFATVNVRAPVHERATARYGEQYEAYRQAVPAWRPRPRPWIGPE